MTKKAIKEKYLNELNDTMERLNYYKEELIFTINECNSTNYSIDDLTVPQLRKAFIQTLGKLEGDRKISQFVSEYERYQKLKRQKSLLTEILGDIQ